VKPYKKIAHYLNEAIRSPLVFLLDTERKPLGKTDRKQAIALAKSKGLDLVQIAQAELPVCLITDYGKYLYQEHKKEVHPKNHKLKEVQISPNISDHDLTIKATHTHEFLAQGHPVKITCKLHGREKAHPELGQQKTIQFIQKVTGKLVQLTRSGSSFVYHLNPGQLSSKTLA
jgi:translation initiation factor IF-3